MVQDAEKFKEDDEKAKEIIDAKNNYENFVFQMKSTLNDEKMNTLKIDLWTKDMEINNMRRFYIDCIGGIGQSILNSTGDEYMSKEVNQLCDKLIEYLKNKLNNNN